jgi:ribosomal protein S11
MKKQRKYKNKKKGKNQLQQSAITKKRVIQKKSHIFFKYGIGHLLFFQKYSNIFLVLKTENRKHVVTLTSGSCKLGKTKKQKMSPFNVNLIIKELKQYCKIYNINRVRFFLRSTINKHYYNILKYLTLYGIKLIEINYMLHMPHNGVRGRKLRRL